MLPVEQVFHQVHLQSGSWAAQAAVATESVHRADKTEIADWFTGSEKDLALRCDPFNLFFHPLPSGQHALGIIYPVRKGFLSLFQQPQALNVRVLIISPKALFEHGNHPVALIETLRQQQLLSFDPEPPKQLSPLLPAATPLPINSSLLETLADRLGAMSLAQLTQSLFNAECTLFTSRSISNLSVLSALFDLLPIPYRPELTFSSDFFFSAKNSFRLSGFSRLRQRTVRSMKQWGVPVISLEQGNKGSLETLDPWSRFVYQLLQTRDFGFLERHRNIEYQRAMLSPMESQPIIWDNLHEVGVSLSKAMLSGTLPDTHVSATDFPSHSLEELRCVSAVEQLIPMLTVPKSSVAKPVSDQRLADRFPKFREELSELETYLVRVIFGDETVQPNIKRIWSLLLPQLDEESKETMQEAIIATVHSVLVPQDGDVGQRLLRNSQLLELMLFFLGELHVEQEQQSRNV
jgi:hypothetical protein